MLEFQLFRDEHGADLQVARRALPPHPLENLPPMLLPVLRQIEQKALVERSARSLRRATRVSREPRRELAVDAAIDDFGGGFVLGVSVHCLRLVLRRRRISDSRQVSARLRHFLRPTALSFGVQQRQWWFASAPENLCGLKLPRAAVCQSKPLAILTAGIPPGSHLQFRILFSHEFPGFLSNLAIGLTPDVPAFTFAIAAAASRFWSAALV